MGSVHVSCTVDEDLQIYRYISFVELVELLKFGQVHFEPASDYQRSRLLAEISSWRRSTGQLQASDATAVRRARRRNQLLRAAPQGKVAFQTWKVLRGVDALYWNTCSCSDQNVGIVTSIRNLTEALLVRDGTSFVVGRMDDATLQEGAAAPSPHSLAGGFAPGMPSDNVSIVAHADDARSYSHQWGLSVHAVLSTLLSSVIVAPYASERFFDLVAKLVGENTSATVVRPNQLRFDSLRPPIPQAYTPSVSMMEPVACRFHDITAG